MIQDIAYSINLLSICQEFFLHLLTFFTFDASACSDNEDPVTVRIEARHNKADIQRKTHFIRDTKEFSVSRWTKISRAS